ncbi:MAG: VWA domain-containing protein [Bdellovibrionales bacterium]|nr:VWA domain-containing protein [Bdellovibrionales bacterium]
MTDSRPRRELRFMVASALALAASAAAHAADPIQFVFDASGSMSANASGRESRIEAARKAMAQLARSPSALGLTVIGGGLGCVHSSPLFPALGAGSRIVEAVDRLRPSGLTPLSDGIRSAGDALEADRRARPSGQRSILVLTDGLETCGGDPFAAARELRGRDGALSIHVIGFNVRGAARHQLNRLAQEGGGSFQTAATAGSLSKAIENVVSGEFLPQATSEPESGSGGRGPLADPDSFSSEIDFGDAQSAERQADLSPLEAKPSPEPTPLKAKEAPVSDAPALHTEELPPLPML